MSVAVLKLEDETLVAFNLNMISKMLVGEAGLFFIHDGISYTTAHNSFGEKYQVLKLHPSVCGKDGVMLHSAEAMFEKFCNI